MSLPYCIITNLKVPIKKDTKVIVVEDKESLHEIINEDASNIAASELKDTLNEVTVGKSSNKLSLGPPQTKIEHMSGPKPVPT